MTKELASVDPVSTITEEQALLVVANNEVKQISRKNLEKAITPPVSAGATTSIFTLEGSSSPSFHVNNPGAAELYQSQMGGYLFYVSSGKVYAAKLNGATWDKFADGTPVTSAIEAATETMIHLPQCHFKGDNKTLYFGGLTPIDGGKVFDAPNWVGAYLMSLTGSSGSEVGHSRPNVTPGHSKTMSAFWDCAQRLGNKFGLANYQFHCLINALFQARYGNLNSQAQIGAGFQNSNWEACRNVPMGLTKELGDGSGKVLYTDATLGNQYPVKLFGFEDLWGKLWEFRPGIRFYMDGQTRKAVVYAGNLVSNTASGREISGIFQSASGQYTTAMELGENWDMLPKSVGGGESSYYCDGYWAATGGELLAVGGPADAGAHCGVSSALSDLAFSASDARLGARLAFYGEPTIVSGAELAAMI